MRSPTETLLDGSRVRARGLIWDVLEVGRAGDRDRLALRCVSGDMAGLEWEIFAPPEQVEPVAGTIDPRNPGSLAMWHTMHWARLLTELPDGASFVAQTPGRLKIEPYQLVPLTRALDMPRPRLLLADGVGLGKTIQAGLIAAELIARRRAHRILIVTPPGPLIRQWEQETRLRFGLKFTPLTNAAELWDVRRSHEFGANPFDSVALCLTSLDFAKQDHVLEEIERSAWDLVIVDEAHHCAAAGGEARETTQRRRLAEVLARRSDGLLLLTATPHDGHDAHFTSLIGLLDPSLTDGTGGLVGHAYRRHVVRRLKSHIRDPWTGAPLFRRRSVTPVTVDVLGAEHEGVRAFHRALSAFVVPRLRDRGASGDVLAFVSLLKRSVSTIAACLSTLRVVEERLARIAAGGGETKAAQAERARALRTWRRRVARYGGLNAAEEANQQALEVESMAESLHGGAGQDLARLIRYGIDAGSNDPKLAALLREIRLIRLDHSAANILIYTEYTDSQAAAAEAVRAAPGIAGELLTIGGQDPEDVRAATAIQFAANNGLILISTDSMAEGLNLHAHCFHLIHLDLPYNPNRLEQRNGRIDRYGQTREPDIRYLYLPGTFEERLLLHLIVKYEKARASLDVMPDTLGATSDSHGSDYALTMGLSEDPADLFAPDANAIRTLDRAAEETNPDAVADLLREIDRAFESFELMAVSHGWLGPRGNDILPDPDSRHDLADFVGAVCAAETGDPARPPKSWFPGLEGLPGIDSASAAVRVTRDIESYLDRDGQSTAFLGKAHPLVVRAIRHGCQLPGTVSAARADRLGFLTTFGLEIAVGGREMVRRIFAILTQPDQEPVEATDWLRFGCPEHVIADDGVWNRHFAYWAEPDLTKVAALAELISDRDHRAFRAKFDESAGRDKTRLRHWSRVRANLLCGPYAAPTGDLFGQPARGPAWRFERDPAARLVSFATASDTSGPKRREANEILEILRNAQSREAMTTLVRCHRIGLLMLVPVDDA